MIWNTIVVSDLHLGSDGSKADWFLEFLEQHPCRQLILNGDIVDGWALQRGSKWKKKHTKVITKLLKLSNETSIIWIKGNHDEFLIDFLGFNLGKIKIKEDYVLNVKSWSDKDIWINKRYYVFHGDKIDIFMLKYKWISKIGSIGYDFALWINEIYNKWRIKRGKTYFSISKPLKYYVKSASNYINDFEETAIKMAEKHGCHGVICGHIHQDSDRMINEFHYLNSGDWVENMSAILISDDGKIQIWKKTFSK
jgi:UDP-2,3-diacylglucosamine pyrophosphatase LpxH